MLGFRVRSEVDGHDGHVGERGGTFSTRSVLIVWRGEISPDLGQRRRHRDDGSAGPQCNTEGRIADRHLNDAEGRGDRRKLEELLGSRFAPACMVQPKSSLGLFAIELTELSNAV